ncbi:MAG: cupin domain-containing protein [Betaproteobacteria bacterium]|nr:cupin domain-containing protein [Betaproteobacteria bacterium]
MDVLSGILRSVHLGGGVYFRCEFDRDHPHPLVAALPSLIHIRGTDSHDFAWLQTAIHFMIKETRTAKPGAEAVVNRLAEVLFVQMVRAHIAQIAGTGPGAYRRDPSRLLVKSDPRKSSGQDAVHAPYRFGPIPGCNENIAAPTYQSVQGQRAAHVGRKVSVVALVYCRTGGNKDGAK